MSPAHPLSFRRDARLNRSGRLRLLAFRARSLYLGARHRASQLRLAWHRACSASAPDRSLSLCRSCAASERVSCCSLVGGALWPCSRCDRAAGCAAVSLCCFDGGVWWPRSFGLGLRPRPGLRLFTFADPLSFPADPDDDLALGRARPAIFRRSNALVSADYWHFDGRSTDDHRNSGL